MAPQDNRRSFSQQNCIIIFTKSSASISNRGGILFSNRRTPSPGKIRSLLLVGLLSRSTWGNSFIALHCTGSAMPCVHAYCTKIPSKVDRYLRTKENTYNSYCTRTVHVHVRRYSMFTTYLRRYITVPSYNVYTNVPSYVSEVRVLYVYVYGNMIPSYLRMMQYNYVYTSPTLI